MLDGGPRQDRLPATRQPPALPALTGACFSSSMPEQAGLPGRARRRRSRRCPIFPRARPRSFTGGSGTARCPPLPRSDFKTFCDAGRLFAGLHGRLFRAPARRPLCEPRRGRGAGLAAQRGRHRAWPELLGADRLCLRGFRGGGPRRLLDRLRARSQRPGLPLRSRKAATKGPRSRHAPAKSSKRPRLRRFAASPSMLKRGSYGPRLEPRQAAEHAGQALAGRRHDHGEPPHSAHDHAAQAYEPIRREHGARRRLTTRPFPTPTSPSRT